MRRELRMRWQLWLRIGRLCVRCLWRKRRDNGSCPGAERFSAAGPRPGAAERAVLKLLAWRRPAGRRQCGTGSREGLGGGARVTGTATRPRPALSRVLCAGRFYLLDRSLCWTGPPGAQYHLSRIGRGTLLLLIHGGVLMKTLSVAVALGSLLLFSATPAGADDPSGVRGIHGPAEKSQGGGAEVRQVG